MKITPNAALINALSALNEANARTVVPDRAAGLRPDRPAGLRPDRPADLRHVRPRSERQPGAFERARAQQQASPLRPSAQLDPARRPRLQPRVDKAFQREAVDPQSQARRPGLGRVVDILV